MVGRLSSAMLAYWIESVVLLVLVAALCAGCFSLYSRGRDWGKDSPARASRTALTLMLIASVVEAGLVAGLFFHHPPPGPPDIYTDYFPRLFMYGLHWIAVVVFAYVLVLAFLLYLGTRSPTQSRRP